MKLTPFRPEEYFGRGDIPMLLWTAITERSWSYVASAWRVLVLSFR